MRPLVALLIIFIVHVLLELASTSCPPGSRTSFNGSCTPCSPGFREYYGECWECVPRTYQPQAGQNECLRCPPNTTSMAGACSCTTCPQGTKILSGNTCGVCAAGRFYDAEHYTGCTRCRPGFFKAKEGLMPCLPCPPNSHSSYGSTNCTFCPENQTLLRNGSGDHVLLENITLLTTWSVSIVVQVHLQMFRM